MIRTLLLLTLGALPALGQTPDLPAISVVPVEMQRMTERVIASGLVQPVNRIDLYPLIDGQPVEALLADLGDRVEVGAVLARLSTDALELQRSRIVAQRASAVASVAQARAGLAEAQAAEAEAQGAASRARELAARNAASAATLEQALANAASATARVESARQSIAAAEAEVQVAEAQLADLDLQVARAEVRAPQSGLVIERNAVVGAVSSAGAAPMFVLAEDGALELRAEVAEPDLLRLRPGQPARLTTATGDTIDGEVRLIEPQIDADTRLGHVRIAAAAPLLRPGMFLRAAIVTADRTAPSLPLTAVGMGPDGAYAMQSDDGTVRRRPVTTGIRDTDRVEITSGLAPGDKVVARAGAFVRDGDRIAPVDP
ncbi:efflux RND transporter periplasmic adaptor subunit [Falsirhodobacter algicola]|uniref:Efflux RND transporter periplasmic adaptor subunit n=1 Tax=Falsirhodobacter algicola TaxID=2692330 RepID=A0A8J8MSJ9_9RHOB|nr:efflux RND transporter periplasmic adaptor subunit [Falsirhodobacter algicola]QUS35677.1 efflux RND transporter periplasmic adaptor subunit [Falsirhodobacter algicola]